MSKEKFRRERDNIKDIGIKSRRQKYINLEDLTKEEQGHLELLKTIALAFYKKADHASDAQRIVKPPIRGKSKTKKPPSFSFDAPSEGEVSLTYRRGEISENVLDVSIKTWLKNNKIWKEKTLNNMLVWKDYLTQFDIAHEVDADEVQVDPISLGSFLEKSEPYIKALQAKEEARKELDPTSDSTDSYLLANIRCIRDYCREANPAAIQEL